MQEIIINNKDERRSKSQRNIRNDLVTKEATTTTQQHPITTVVHRCNTKQKMKNQNKNK